MNGARLYAMECRVEAEEKQRIYDVTTLRDIMNKLIYSMQQKNRGLERSLRRESNKML